MLYGTENKTGGERVPVTSSRFGKVFEAALGSLAPREAGLVAFVKC